MKRRAESMARVARLAAQMRELGRWRRSAIERESAQLSDDLRAVFEALESASLAYSAHAGLGAGRARLLQKRLDALTHESERAERAARAHGLRAKLAETAAEAADKAYRDDKARKELAEIVDAALRRRDASPG